MKIRKHRITAAFEDTDNGFMEGFEDIADTVEDMQEELDDSDELEEADVEIEIENNIDNHYIAECDRCQGIFISAVVESDQEIESIEGVCPLCNKDSIQYLKWLVKSV